MMDVRTRTGISQRDLTFYDFLQDATLQSKVKAMVQLFFDEVVLPNFPLESCKPSSFSPMPLIPREDVQLTVDDSHL